LKEKKLADRHHEWRHDDRKKNKNTPKKPRGGRALKLKTKFVRKENVQHGLMIFQLRVAESWGEPEEEEGIQVWKRRVVIVADEKEHTEGKEV